MLFRGLLVLLITILATPAHAQESNAGIVRGLWYDRETFFAGETVRVYVAVRNNTGSDLSGTVEFLVDGKRIERNNIDALNGRIIESWADWKVTYGTATISATLSRTEITSTASGSKAISVISALAADTLFVDRDTDKDGVGDIQDTDDDNDTIPDKDDAEPLVFNKPPTAAPPPVSQTETATDAAQTPLGPPVGLEQFFTESRADNALEQITEVVNTTKKKLDTYREERKQNKPNESPAPNTEGDNTSSSSSPSIDTDASGFGSITRTTTDITEKNISSGWLKSVWNFITTVADWLYTLLLSALSLLLAHPTIVQILILVGIILSIYKTAKKFGSRPGGK